MQRDHFPRASSQRWIAKRCGLAAGTLPNILSGRRHPQPETVVALSKVFGWSAEQLAFFELLVAMERSGSEDGRRRAVDAVYAERAQRDRGLSGRLERASEWAELFVRELVTLPSFTPDGVWIAKRLGGRLDPGTAEAVLATLMERGLVTVGEDGVWFAPPQAHAATVGRHGRSVHMELLDLASETVQRTAKDDRVFVSATLAIPKSAFPGLKRGLFRAIQRLAHDADAAEAPAEELVQLQVQFYRLEAPVRDER